MKSQVIQEFKSSVRETLGTQVGSYIVWESPRLTLQMPDPDSPKGSDRLVCRTVNGILQISAPLILSNLDAYSSVAINAGLYGEMEGIPCLIKGTQYSLFASPKDFLATNGRLSFDVWSSFSNLAQNIFIRVVFTRGDTSEGVQPLPLNLTFNGALIGASPG